MTADNRFERIRDIFEKALELPESDREAFLNEAAGGDGELLSEVLSLLEADGEAGSFMDQPVIATGSNEDRWIGKTVGHYRIVELLAGGGMGVVYLAEQKHPRRRVALKLIRSSAVSEQLLRRFELEAEVLGRLDHPGIAQIFEASTAETELGPQPFFAMEFVDGPRLTDFAAQRELRTRERVGLLVKVCEALHHAHQNGIIHRDLKPANILVREDGQPKILDFGVARMTDADVQATTMHTDIGQIIGTLSYMSPEQVRGRHEDLDIRSDVYALGVVGYELLTGRLPQPLGGKSISEAARIIEQEDPSSLGASGTSFPADLETIIGKCLAKEKHRRYGSASELAADLKRFLDDEPISARPPSVVYQFSKFARRNRALVTGAGIALASLVVGLVISLAGWNSAIKARGRAETEAEKANLLNEYLTEMLQAPDPWADGRDVKVVEVLARASQTLDESLGDRPEVAALAHHRIGYTYSSLGKYEDAGPHLLRALEISGLVGDFPPGARVEILCDLGHLRFEEGNLEEAEKWTREAFDHASLTLEAEHPSRIKSSHDLAHVLWEQGNLDDAERLFRQSLERSISALGADHEETVTSRAALGNVLRQQGKREEARPLLEEAYEQNKNKFGEDHPKTAITLNNLAFLYQELEAHGRALEMFVQSLESRRRAHTNESTSVIIGLNNVGLQLGIMGRGEEALSYLEEAMGISGRILGEGHWMEPAIRSTYGRTLLGIGRHDDAECEMRRSLEGLRAALGDDHWRTRGVCGNLAKLYEETGDAERADEYRALAKEEAAEPDPS